MSYFYIGKYGTLLVCLCERESGHYFLFTFNIWAGNKLIIIIVVVVVVVVIIVIIIIIIIIIQIIIIIIIIIIMKTRFYLQENRPKAIGTNSH